MSDHQQAMHKTVSHDTHQSEKPVLSPPCLESTPEACPCSGSRLESYFRFCDAAIRNDKAFDKNAITKLEDILSHMRSNPDVVPKELDGGHRELVETAVRIAFMTDCSAVDLSDDELEKGHPSSEWKNAEPLSKFVERFFGSDRPKAGGFPDQLGTADTKVDLRATKLRKTLGLSIRPTDDIRDHLKLDRKTMTLEVFHYTGFIKEHLRLTRSLPSNSTVQDALKAGALPRQLMLEVLESLQGVLFPVSDRKSRKMLASFVKSGAFDPDIQNIEFDTIKNKGEETVRFVHLAKRLEDLHHEVLNPKPRSLLERQLDRHIGTRRMMLATLIGVLFAVFLGLFSLAISSYQAYIAYQAWQHPMSPAGA
ncbi:hypothetical protein K4K56_007368 [Colletotrichum sp. SAR 10_98]|nr:hypothetical protein K4K56_007368 [Colletotrichum sp. SAR 10_98]